LGLRPTVVNKAEKLVFYVNLHSRRFMFPIVKSVHKLCNGEVDIEIHIVNLLFDRRSLKCGSNRDRL
jgi:hypothetical protein